MMLDHTRDFVHHDSFVFDPTDVTSTWSRAFRVREPRIPGVGHHLVENSPAFNAEVLRFLDSSRR